MREDRGQRPQASHRFASKRLRFPKLCSPLLIASDMNNTAHRVTARVDAKRKEGGYVEGLRKRETNG